MSCNASCNKLYCQDWLMFQPLWLSLKYKYKYIIRLLRPVIPFNAIRPYVTIITVCPYSLDVHTCFNSVFIVSVCECWFHFITHRKITGRTTGQMIEKQIGQPLEWWMIWVPSSKRKTFYVAISRISRWAPRICGHVQNVNAVLFSSLLVGCGILWPALYSSS